MNNNDKLILIKRKPTHYEIYVDGKFYSTCDFGELRDEMEEIENEEIPVVK